MRVALPPGVAGLGREVARFGIRQTFASLSILLLNYCLTEGCSLFVRQALNHLEKGMADIHPLNYLSTNMLQMKYHPAKEDTFHSFSSQVLEL